MAIENQTLDEYLGLAAASTSANGHTPTTINNYANLDNSLTSTDGIVDSNANKIWNDVSSAELQAKLGDTVGNSAITRDEAGNKYSMQNGELLPYVGDTRRLYMYGTKGEGDDVKVGLSSSKNKSSDARYTPILGWPSGEQGVDISKKILDVELPYSKATELEAIIHGNKSAQESRLVKLEDAKKRKLFGSGASEYYDSMEGIFGDVSKVDTTNLQVPSFELNAEARKALLPRVPTRGVDALGGTDTAGSSILTEYVIPKADKTEYSTAGRVGNMFKGFVAGAAGGAYDLADIGAEMVGKDLGTDEQKTAKIDKVTGYDRGFTAKAADKVKSEISRMDTEGVDAKGVLKVLATGVSTPEFLTESLGYLAPMLIGGPMSVGAKGVATASRGLKLAQIGGDAAKIGEATEALNVANAAYSGTAKALDFVSKNAGLLGVSAGTTNDDMDEFAKKAGIAKKDVDPTKVVGAFLSNVVLNSIDKWTDLGVLKNPSMAEGLSAVVKGMTTKQLDEFGRGMAKVANTAVIGGAKEGGTEYVQTFIEQVNKQVGEQTGKTIADAWNDENNKLERATAGALGVTGAQQMNIASVAGSALSGGTGKSLGALQAEMTRRKEAAAVEPVAESAVTSTARTPEDFEVFRTALTTMRNKVVNDSYTTDDYKTISELENTWKSMPKELAGGKHKVIDEVFKLSKERMATSLANGTDTIELGSKEDVFNLIQSLQGIMKDEPEERQKVIERIVELGSKVGVDRDTIVKTALEVDKDVKNGGGGYYVKGAILNELRKDPEANSDKIATAEADLTRFANTQEAYANALGRGIEKVKSDIKSGLTQGEGYGTTKEGKQYYDVSIPTATGGKFRVYLDGKGDTLTVNRGAEVVYNYKKENIAAINDILKSAAKTVEPTAEISDVPDVVEVPMEVIATEDWAGPFVDVGINDSTNGIGDLQNVVGAESRVEEVVANKWDVLRNETRKAIQGKLSDGATRDEVHEYLKAKVSKPEQKKVLEALVKVLDEEVAKLPAIEVEAELLSSRYADTMETSGKLEVNAKRAGKLDISKLSESTRSAVNKKIEAISGTLKDGFVKSQSKAVIADLVKKSPLYALLNDNGELPRQVVEAMAIAQLNFEGSRLGDIAYPDARQVRAMLGMPDSAIVSSEMLLKMGKIGRFLNNEATGIGADILKNLPIKASVDADMHLNERLKADLGRALLISMSKQGIVEIGSVGVDVLAKLSAGSFIDNGAQSSEEATSIGTEKTPPRTIKVKGKYNSEAAKESRELLNAIDEQLELGGTELEPRFYKKKEDRSVSARRMSAETVVPKRQQDAINVAENTAIELNVDAVSRIKELYELDAEAVLSAFGKVDAALVHKDVRAGVEAKNRIVESSLTDLFEFMNKADGRDFYFNYFFSKNGRFFIDSTKIDPQDNTIHRFLFNVSAKSNTVTSESMHEFEYAIVQGFDGVKALGDKLGSVVDSDNDTSYGDNTVRGVSAVDKQGPEKTSEDFKVVLGSELVQAAVKGDNKALLRLLSGAKHPSHLIGAIEALKVYKSEENFDTKMVAEIDSVNNGFTLGLLANPVMNFESLVKELKGVGVWVGENLKNLTYGKWKEVQGNLDAYETGVVAVNSKLNRDLPIVELIGSVVRNMMKYPLMIFVYGGGLSGIRKGITSDLVQAQLNKWSTDSGLNSSREILIRILESSIGREKKEIDKARKSGTVKSNTGLVKQEAALKWVTDVSAETIRETSVETAGELQTLVAVVRKEIDSTYGTEIAGYLNEKYSDLVNMRDAVSSVFAGAFNVFKTALDAELEKEITSSGFVSKKRYDEILKKMVDEGKVPGILTVDSKNKNEKVAVIGTKSEPLPGVDNRVSSKIGGSDSVSVNPKVLEYIMSPTSGSVGNIHSFDGGLISFLIAEKMGIGVHDALVALVGKLTSSAKLYNEKEITRTLEFDMVERVLNEGKINYDENRDEFDKGIIESILTKFGNKAKLSYWVAELDTIRESMTDVTGEATTKVQTALESNYKGDREVKTMEAILGAIQDALDWEVVLDTAAITIAENKAKIRELGLTANNMAGPQGSAYVLDKATREEVREVKKEVKKRGATKDGVKAKTKLKEGIISKEESSTSSSNKDLVMGVMQKYIDSAAVKTIVTQIEGKFKC